eukprot:m.107028 g.107028  ORF g.107028 m.107028 type:complete len:381 (-) comp8964_c0_seq1:178-1320(-)
MWSWSHAAYMGKLHTLLADVCHVKIEYNRDKSLDRLHDTFRTRDDGFLVMCGEESLTGRMCDALTAFNAKIHVWNPLLMGEIPYLLLFATAGPDLRFFAMDSHLDLVPQCDPIDVTTYEGVLMMTLVMVNAFRLMRTMVTLAPPFGSPSLGKEVLRPGSSCTITFGPSSVDKVFFAGSAAPQMKPRLFSGGVTAMTMDRLDDLKQLYDRLMGVIPVPHCMEVPTSTSVEECLNLVVLTVTLQPLGIKRRPMGIDELRQAVYAVLSALSVLHGIGYAHRDPRWDNVIIVPAIGHAGSSRWCLIDYGSALSLGAVEPDASNFGPGFDGVVTARNDLRLVARHLLVGQEALPGVAALKAYLTSSTVTVKRALKHAFFAELRSS